MSLFNQAISRSGAGKVVRGEEDAGLFQLSQLESHLTLELGAGCPLLQGEPLGEGGPPQETWLKVEQEGRGT